MNFFNLVAAICTITGLQACASMDMNKQLNEKISKESSIKSRKDLDAKATGLMANAPGLSGQQRQRMNAIKAQLNSKLKDLNEESLKLRSLLLQDVIASGDRTQEVNAVKNRLRANSTARIDAIFNAVDQANDVLGRNELISEAMDMQVMEDEAQF
jgi:hypothetical protein